MGLRTDGVSPRQARVIAARSVLFLTLGLVVLPACDSPTSLGPGDRSGRLRLQNTPDVFNSESEVAIVSSSSIERISAEESHLAMVGLLREISGRVQDENIWIGDNRTRELRQALLTLPPGSDEATRARLNFFLGRSECDLGNELDAIKHFETAYGMLDSVRNVLEPTEVHEIIFRLGLAHLRHGETLNCCQRNSPESCILPIRGQGIHTRQESSREAIRYFTEVLETTSGQHLRARWLLNVAYMTIGEYPANVPADYLVPPEVFASQVEFPRFENIATRVGLNSFNLVGSAVVEDFDNDGFLDILTSTWDPTDGMHFFRNLGNGSFDERSDEAGLSGLLGGINMVQADYDNDGDADVLVLRGAWLFRVGRHPNSLLRNDGDGVFTDVTFQAGLGDVHYPSHVAGWADYDNDGDLDLYVGNEYPEGDRGAAAGQLFRNNGDGTFNDVAREAGVENRRFAKGVVWGDYDGDRFPDLYVSNMQDLNRLYHNNGDGTFTDVAEELGVSRPKESFPVWFWDFDNDGALDLYVPSYRGDKQGLTAVAASYLDLPHEMELNRLYRGDGAGGFQEVAEDYGLTRLASAMGANFGDLDNDGFLDFYLGTGFPDYEALMPNVMYHNQAGKGFVDVTTSGGFGHLQKGHGVTFSDLDHDGDQDIFEQLGGNFLGDKYFDALFENPGFDNHWITIQLVGVRSNRSAIGARIHVVVTENGQQRSIYKHVNSGGSFGANPLRQSIGVGKATRIERLEVFWPTTGETQAFADVAVDQGIRIREDSDEIESLDLQQFSFPRQ